MRLNFTRSLLGVSLLALSVPAFAQDAEGEESEEAKKEIVVTGTMIRGAVPGGTNVISVGQADVVETGATSTSQLLQTIPQLGSFNQLDRPLGGGNFVTSNRPNLRSLPGFTTNGSSPTLVLIDGHRVVGAGISSTSPDADFVPPGAIARVEIVSDGGSAIYGSDAVAGVINFITRRDINGVEANSRYGFADNYHTIDGNLAVGKTWDGGGVYATYSYSYNDQILGSDRDFVQTFPANTGLAIPITNLECPGGNVNVRGSVNVYGLPYTPATSATKLNIANQCDQSDYSSLYPEQKRHTVFVGLRQQLSDKLEVNLRGFYLNKQTYQSLGLFHETRLLVGPFLGFTGLPVSPYAASYSPTGSNFDLLNVSYGYGNADSQNQRIKMQAWGFIPEFKYDLGGSFQARLMGNYGESITDQHSPILNANAIAAALPSGLFNPFVVSSSDPRTLAELSNYETFGRSEQTQADFRLVIDGELFQIGDSAAKIAFGTEWLKETFNTQRGQIQPGFQNSGYAATTITGAAGGSWVNPARPRIPIYDLNRTVKAAFGELVVPIADMLTLSASGRYDHYSDFGGTFNPRFGATFKPVDWLTLRASQGKNFAAPSLADAAVADPPTLNFFSGGTFGFLVPTSVLVANGFPAPTAANSNGIITLGAKPGLQPQRAKTWSMGFDIEPQGSGLKLGASYYNLNYKGLIGLLPFTSATTYFSEFRSNFIVNPTQAQIDAAIAGATIINGSNCAPSPACVYIVEDARKQNLGGYKVSGIDFSGSYTLDTGFGSVDFATFGNYELSRKQAASATSAFIDQLVANNSRFRIRSSLGLNAGGFRAQATWSHNQGYKLNPVVPAAGGFPAQDRVGSFNVIDLFFKYDTGGEGALKDLSFTLNVNNAFDTDPPVWRAQQVTNGTNGYANGNTLGRYVQFGIAKKF